MKSCEDTSIWRGEHVTISILSLIFLFIFLSYLYPHHHDIIPFVIIPLLTSLLRSTALTAPTAHLLFLLIFLLIHHCALLMRSSYLLIRSSSSCIYTVATSVVVLQISNNIAFRLIILISLFRLSLGKVCPA